MCGLPPELGSPCIYIYLFSRDFQYRTKKEKKKKNCMFNFKRAYTGSLLSLLITDCLTVHIYIYI